MLAHFLQIFARLHYWRATVGDLKERCNARINMGLLDFLITVALFILTTWPLTPHVKSRYFMIVGSIQVDTVAMILLSCYLYNDIKNTELELRE